MSPFVNAGNALLSGPLDNTGFAVLAGLAMSMPPHSISQTTILLLIPGDVNNNDGVFYENVKVPKVT